MRIRDYLKTGLIAAVCSLLFGCSEPPAPLEVQMALEQEQDLWRAGASVFAPEEYGRYLISLAAGREMLARERGKFVWFRNYAPVTSAFRRVLEEGELVRAAAGNHRQRQTAVIAAALEQLHRRAAAVRALAASIKDRRLSRRKLVEAEVRLEEARALSRAGRLVEAQQKIEEAATEIDGVVAAIRPLLLRYADRQQIGRWRQLAEGAAAESKRRGGYAIVVKKIDRELILYRNGRPYRTYPAGLGFNYLTGKLHSGDLATPEGRYEVVRKLPASRFYLALLINYPNEEDRRRFAKARREGRIPSGVGIGSLIEIHGGGTDGMTEGCIALENPQMRELFQLVEVGTPVVIVGTVDDENIVVTALGRMEEASR